MAEGSRNDHFSAGFQINFGWGFFDKNVGVFKNNQSASGYYQVHQSEYSNISNGAHRLRFTSNHDKCAWEDTPLGFFGGKAASMSAFVISTYLGGVPLIYDGQEVGCPVKLPFFQRKTATDEVAVIVNTRSTVKTFQLPTALQNTTWQDAWSGLSVTLGSSLSLNAFEYRILVK